MDSRLLFNYFVKFFSFWIILLQLIQIPCGAFCLFNLGEPLEKCDLDGLFNGIIYFWSLLIISNCCYSLYCFSAIILIYIWRKSVGDSFNFNFMKIATENIEHKRSIHKKIFIIWVTCALCIATVIWMRILNELDSWLVITYISSLLFNVLACSYLYRCDFKHIKYCYGCTIEDYPLSNSEDESNLIIDENRSSITNYIAKRVGPISRVLKSMCKITCTIILLYNMIHIVYDTLDISLRKHQNEEQIKITTLYIISFLLYRISICYCLMDIA